VIKLEKIECAERWLRGFAPCAERWALGFHGPMCPLCASMQPAHLAEKGLVVHYQRRPHRIEQRPN